MDQAAVGFRIKSGWAVAVLVAGTPAAPVLLDVRTVQLSDPAVPDSAQPYHAALELHKAAGDREAARLVKVVERFSRKSLDALFEDYASRGRLLTAAGVVVGSQVDPATIANQHIRAHAEEGRVFRRVVADAAARAGLKVSVIAEKDLFEDAAKRLNRPAARLKKDVTALGEPVVGSWRAEQKGAALAAWMSLA